MSRSTLRSLTLWVFLTAAYFIVGKFGLRLAFVHPNISPVWPATGLAVASFLLFGYRVWPCIFIAAWLVNQTTGGSTWTSLVIALGNTLEGFLGAYGVNRFSRGRRFLENPRDVVTFTLFAAVLAPTVSATLGVTSLTAAGYAPAAQYGPLWLTWWLGDMVGAIIVAPALVAWTLPPSRWNLRRKIEAVLLTLGLGLMTAVIFAPGQKHSLAVLCIPLILAAAFRLGPAGTALFNLGLAAVAIFCTLRGWGPFVMPSTNLSLLSLQTFMGTSAVMALVIAAAVAERKRFEQRLRVQYALGRLYLEIGETPGAITNILCMIAEEFDWEFGAFWVFDRESQLLRCQQTWQRPDLQLTQFQALTRRTELAPGQGLPGRIWAGGEPVWLSDLQNETNFPRLQVAAHEGLRAGFGFPIRSPNGLLGLVEFFSRATQPVDRQLLQTFTVLGNQIAQYLERSRLDLERVELNKTLEQQVRLRSDELLRKEAQLHQASKLEAVGRLAGGIAHDFNNLLTGILGISEDLLQSLPETDSRHEDVQDIITSARRAFAVTRQLLAFGRRQVVQPRTLDMNATIREVNKLLHRLIGEDIQIALELAAVGAILADPSQIEQILLNLAVNARDAMPQGGRLEIRTAMATLRERGQGVLHARPGTYVVLDVSDTGAGMSAAVLNHIFEPFFTTKEPGKGTGLGLATVYGIVEQNEGDIVVSSAPLTGTRFQIYWPVSPNVAERPQETVVAVKDHGRETILVVEDEEIVRRVIIRKLKQAGYHVLEAPGGRQAIELARSQATLDVLVTDVVMPELNGRQTADAILEIKPAVKVIFVSGYPEDVIGDKGVLEPGVCFIEKPLLTEHLLRKVREVLDA